jgi:hypothetical protein
MAAVPSGALALVVLSVVGLLAAAIGIELLSIGEITCDPPGPS